MAECTVSGPLQPPLPQTRPRLRAAHIPWSPPLVAGTLIRRYKRFLSDVRLEDGREVIAHCMNTGAMTGLTEPGSRVWLTPHDDPKRKLRWTWQIASDGDTLVGVNTQLPNRLAARAIESGLAEPLRGYRSLRAEVRYGAEGSRIDLLLDDHPADPRPCYVEVKNVTLAVGSRALFPDARTARGLKHLRELARVAADGQRAVMFYIVDRADVDRFAPAGLIDPDYAAGLRAAAAAGVEVLAYGVDVSPVAMGVACRLEVELG